MIFDITDIIRAIAQANLMSLLAILFKTKALALP
jgi:hypothetical protein